LTPGQHGDCPQFIPLLDQVRIARRGKVRPRTRPGRAMAGKAYSSAANRAYLRKRRIQAVIPVKEDQKKHRRNRGRAGGRPPGFDAGRYKERNTVLPVQLVRTVNQAALMVRRRSAIPVTGLPSQFCPAFFRDWLAGAGAFVRAIT